MKRKLLFFFDGSSNYVAGPSRNDPTNVFYLNQAFTNGKNHDQVSFYFSGVGTRGDRLSAVTGRGFDQIVTEAYTNLASNYVHGDQVYLFGFSRGAAAARVLSAMLSYPGLLKDINLSSGFPTLWKLFTLYTNNTLNDLDKQVHEDRLRDRLIVPAPKVKFIGVFDTVPGVSWDQVRQFVKLRIRDLGLEESVEHAVQILAADDNRLPTFQPMLWNQLKAEPPESQTVQQIWMPGVHGDIGGHSQARFIGNLALLTMLEQVQKYCPELELDAEYMQEVYDRTFHTKGMQIHITNERGDLGDKLLRKGIRSANGQFPPPLPGMCKHELLDGLKGKKIVIRQKAPKVYGCHESFDALPVFQSKYSKEIAAVLSRVPGGDCKAGD